MSTSSTSSPRSYSKIFFVVLAAQVVCVLFALVYYKVRQVDRVLYHDPDPTGTEFPWMVGLIEQHRAWARSNKGRFAHVSKFHGLGRIDFRCPNGAMCDVMRRVDVRPAPEEDTSGSIFWSIQFKMEGVSNLEDAYNDGMYAGVNMFPGLAYLGDKLQLGVTLQECVDELGADVCDMVPLSFQLPLEHDAWKTFVHHNPEGFWIVKPRGGFSSVGVHVIGGNEEVTKDGEWAVQQYVHSPLLFMKHKFDMRVWALVTSLDPLRVYMVKDAFPKVSTSEFNADPALFGDSCVHLTSPTKACSRDFLENVPDCVRDAWFQRGIGLLDPDARVPSWELEVWPSVERAVVKTILMGMPRALETHRRLQRDLYGYEGFSHLSFDVIVEDTGRAFVEEVNFNGFLEFQRGMNGGTKGGYYLVDEMRILGLGGGYDRRPYQIEFLRQMEAFCDSFQCTQEDMRTLQDLADEDGAKGSYKRVFPPNEGLSAHGYDKFFTNRKGMEVSRANLVVWEYLYFLHGETPEPPTSWSDLGPAINPKDSSATSTVTAGLRSQRSKPDDTKQRNDGGSTAK